MSYYHKKNQMVSAKSPSDYESAWSPTSPLDFRMLSTFANPFGGVVVVAGRVSPPRSIRKRQKKSWDSEKVGLSIVDSSESKNIIFGSMMRSGNPKCPKPHHFPNPILGNFPYPFVKTPSLKEVDVVELSSTSYCSNASVNNNACQVIKSEDYTCVTTHGSNPKITHLYGDPVLEIKKEKESIFEIAPLEETLTDDLVMIPPPNGLRFCCFCSKRLALGKDIYMYRDRGFCSSECRLEEIVLDDEMMEEDEEIAEDLSKKKSNSVFFTVG